MKTKVNVRDKQNVVDALKAEGYSETELNAFIKIIAHRFMAYTKMVYGDLLKKKPPQLITVNLIKVEDDTDQRTTVSFLSYKSSNDHLFFEIYQPLFKRGLDHPTDSTFSTTVIHEMMHAADLPTMEQINKVLNRLKRKMNGNSNKTSLYHTMQMLKQLREDSIAQLGRFLLAQMKMEIPDITLNDSRHLSDYAGPCILLLTLEKMGLVKSKLVHDAFEGFQTGRYLEKRHAMTILHEALSLSLADFIKGLLLVGEEYTPYKTIIDKIVGFERINNQIILDFANSMSDNN